MALAGSTVRAWWLYRATSRQTGFWTFGDLGALSAVAGVLLMGTALSTPMRRINENASDQVKTDFCAGGQIRHRKTGLSNRSVPAVMDHSCAPRSTAAVLGDASIPEITCSAVTANPTHFCGSLSRTGTPGKKAVPTGVSLLSIYVHTKHTQSSIVFGTSMTTRAPPLG